MSLNQQELINKVYVSPLNQNDITKVPAGALILLNNELKVVETMTPLLGTFYNPFNSEEPQITYTAEVLKTLKQCRLCNNWEIFSSDTLTQFSLCSNCTEKSKHIVSSPPKLVSLPTATPLDDLVTKVVKCSTMTAKEIAEQIGKPYSTLMREVNPLDKGAKLDTNTLIKIIKVTGDESIINYILDEIANQ